ncbi:MAG: hypothetical protein WEG36_10310 [Gemmatimonadota bacterium]
MEGAGAGRAAWADGAGAGRLAGATDRSDEGVARGAGAADGTWALRPDGPSRGAGSRLASVSPGRPRRIGVPRGGRSVEGDGAAARPPAAVGVPATVREGIAARVGSAVLPVRGVAVRTGAAGSSLYPGAVAVTHPPLPTAREGLARTTRAGGSLTTQRTGLVT